MKKCLEVLQETVYSLLQDRSNQYYSWSSCLQGSLGFIRGHHVYKEVWHAMIGEMLKGASDDRKEAKEYDKYAVGLYKGDLLVGHIPIEFQVYVSILSIKIQGTKYKH